MNGNFRSLYILFIGQYVRYPDSVRKMQVTLKQNRDKDKETENMKGYYTNAGYRGWIGDRYMLFSSESDYIEYMEE